MTRDWAILALSRAKTYLRRIEGVISDYEVPGDQAEEFSPDITGYKESKT